MDNRNSVGVRYCGGCNSRYDRVAAVKALEHNFPQVSFVPADSHQELTLLICGCPSQCVSRGDLSGEWICLYEEKHFDVSYLRARI